MSTVKRFEDLEVWKLARVFCQDIYQLIWDVKYQI